MAITTQDVVKGLDFTGIPSVTASQLNQHVDVARLASNKGMIIETQDTALNVPEVPNPDGNYSSILPIWWKRYIWRRTPFDASGVVRNYYWETNQAPDATYLKWVRFDKDIAAIAADTATALSNSITALNTANTAISTANGAVSTANTALSTANTAQTNAINAQTAVGNLEDVVDALWAPGDVKPTCATTVFSTISDQKWLECDGSAVSRTVFSRLFTALGTTYGAGDGSTTFNIPNFRGRALIGAGTGAGLTARALGQQTIGAETHQLTANESGLRQHNHAERCGDPSADAIGGGGANRRTFGITGDPGTTNPSINTADVASANAIDSHNNMQPSAVVRWLIKT